MVKPAMPPSKKIAVFGGSKLLVAEIKSMRAAAQMCRIDINNISKACSGKSAAYRGYYWRTIPADIELVEEDFNNKEFSIVEFDELAGNQGRNYLDFKIMNKKKNAKRRGSRNGRKK